MKKNVLHVLQFYFRKEAAFPDNSIKKKLKAHKKFDICRIFTEKKELN